MSGLKIALAQLNFTIGDFESNTAKMADVIFQAKQDKVDLILTRACDLLPSYLDLAISYQNDEDSQLDWYAQIDKLHFPK